MQLAHMLMAGLTLAIQCCSAVSAQLMAPFSVVWATLILLCYADEGTNPGKVKEEQKVASLVAGSKLHEQKL